MLDRAAIALRIPHHGAMCLLDAVLAWDQTAIHCRATSHRHAGNPLREGGQLGIAAAIEYAAQAMAVHGSLLAADPHETARQGYLASVRSVAFHVQRLDDVEGELQVDAERLSGDARQVLYRFSVSASDRPLATGRAAVILDAAA